MSTVVDVDFSRVLPPNASAPRVAVADITALSASGEEEKLVLEGVVINLRRSEVVVPVSPGDYLVRLRIPTGQLLSKRVRVRGGDYGAELTFVPAGLKKQTEVLYGDDGEELKVAVREISSNFVKSKSVHSVGPADRNRWTAKLMQVDDATLSYLPGLQVKEVVNERQDYMGVAKLKARPRAEVLLSEERPKQGVSAYLVGNIDAVQAAKLYGDSAELRAQWKNPLRKQSIIGKASQEAKGARFFALSYRATEKFSPLQVACMPGRWVTQQGSLALVEATYHPRRVGSRLTRGMRLEVDDPDLGGLLDFLQQGDLSGAARIVEQSLGLLYDKWKNPYAAAAAGYVLVSGGLSATSAWGSWEQWVLNLAGRYTALPDGAILYATLLLQGPPGVAEGLNFHPREGASFRTPLGAVLEAVRRGPPLFRYGLKLMSTNIEILVKEPGLERAKQRELHAAQRYMRELSLRVDPDQPFCVFDVAR